MSKLTPEQIAILRDELTFRIRYAEESGDAYTKGALYGFTRAMTVLGVEVDE